MFHRLLGRALGGHLGLRRACLLRDPLKPDAPAVPHDNTLPLGSVMVTIVLLNDALMCACPTGTDLRSRGAHVRPSWVFRPSLANSSAIFS